MKNKLICFQKFYSVFQQYNIIFESANTSIATIANPAANMPVFMIMV
jgi:hypothetical protein